MARPVGVEEVQPRKRMAPRGSTDGQGYLLSDSGCKGATVYLGHPSLCFLCPFDECKIDIIGKRGPKGKNVSTKL